MQRLAIAVLGAALGLPSVSIAQGFVNFESPQTHPIAVSDDGTRLYAVNTPDSRLAVFSLVNPDLPLLLREIPVGLEPVSVTPRTADEVWVVDRVGDSISVVSTSQGLVTATIRVPDEPADITFAGNPEVALVSISGAEELLVIDPQSHSILATLPIFADEPRALAKSNDGNTVWLAAHRSGNRTTIVGEADAPPPPPPTGSAGPAPSQGIIVDAANPTWQSAHGITLPDYDVFEINVASRTITRRYSGIGTILFNIAVHPTTGDLWVANTEALNLVRFEPNLRGHFVDNRLTQITPGSSPAISIHDLNPGIDYNTMPNPTATASALAQPTDVTFVGSELWVAAFGTDRVATVDGAGNVTGFVELGAAGATADPRNKRGPRGLAPHPTADRLYVSNRLSGTISVINTQTRTALTEFSLGFDPTPANVRDGRGFLYDAKLSGNGTASCAGCHIDGEIDGEAWDLGDRGGDIETIVQNTIINGVPLPSFTFNMHPMKGPMTTQTLRGLTPDVEPLHWRGDQADFDDFNPAFDSLMGGSQLSAGDMADYSAFAATMAFPPNPNQNLDRTLPTSPAGVSAQDGLDFFVNTPFTTGVTCNACHTLPTGTNGSIIPGFVLQEPQSFKIPHLRNAYKRMGREPVGGLSTSGYGFLHDGSLNSPFDLLSMPVFQGLANQTNNKRKLERFIMALDTGIAPTVGYSVTVDSSNVSDTQVLNDLALLEQQAQAGNCDLIATGSFQGTLRGFAYDPSTPEYQSDDSSLGAFTLAQLTGAISTGNATLTFKGVPVGSGQRMGIDREQNGVLDGEEGVSNYGQPTPACNPVMRLRANSAPHIGNGLFAVVVDNVQPSSAGVFYMNSIQASLPFKGLEFLVGFSGALTFSTGSDARGVGVLSLPLPDWPVLVGATLYTQAIYPELCSGITPFGLSDGLAFTIGQ